MSDKQPAYDLANMKQFLQDSGLQLVEGTPEVPNSFGITHELFPETLVDVNDYFVRFRCLFWLSHAQVQNDDMKVLKSVNELNDQLSLAKIVLHHDDTKSFIMVVAILPDLFDPRMILKLYDVWQENLFRLMAHDIYSYSTDTKT